MELPPLGEGMGRGFRRVGEGPLLAAVFVPAKAGLFERPEAAFFYRRGGWRHAPHDGGDGGDDTEENSFSDNRRHRPRQGEAAIRHTAFCIYVITLASAINNGENAKKKPPSNFILPPCPLYHLADMLGEMSVGR